MTDNFIQLEDKNILRLKIKDSKGNETGEELIFDLDDIELPLKLQEMQEQNKKNLDWIKNQFLIIEKRQDVKGKKLLSKNEEDKLKAMNEFFNKEIEVYNMFLGENGIQKLLNGNKLGWTSLKIIDKIIVEQIAPKLQTNMKTIQDKIKDTYSTYIEKDVLK